VAVLTSDAERERAAATLREHFVRGRLTVDELSQRTEHVLAARSRGELRLALRDLPVVPDLRSFAAHGRRLARGAVLLIATVGYLLFSMALLLVFGIVLVLRDPSTAELVAFLVVWLVPTWLLARLWRRAKRVRRASETASGV
jgi:Flp pilus assembly protein TadB